MAIPNPSTFGAFKSAAAHLAPHALVGGLIAFTSLQSYRERVSKGMNPAFSAAMEGASLAAFAVLSPTAYFALTAGVPAVRATTTAIIGQVKEQNNMVRMARTPFSHRFEHSDVSARAQALGLQAIGSAWGHARMGSEAAAFARRYGR
jgi:hypothetical protein